MTAGTGLISHTQPSVPLLLEARQEARCPDTLAVVQYWTAWLCKFLLVQVSQTRESRPPVWRSGSSHYSVNHWFPTGMESQDPQFSPCREVTTQIDSTALRFIPQNQKKRKPTFCVVKKILKSFHWIVCLYLNLIITKKKKKSGQTALEAMPN